MEELVLGKLLFNFLLLDAPWVVAFVLLHRVRGPYWKLLLGFLGAQAAAKVVDAALSIWLTIEDPRGDAAIAAFERHWFIRNRTVVPLLLCSAALLLVCALKFRRAVADNHNLKAGRMDDFGE